MLICCEYKNKIFLNQIKPFIYIRSQRNSEAVSFGNCLYTPKKEVTHFRSC